MSAKSPENLLMIADSDHNANMLYATNLFVPSVAGFLAKTRLLQPGSFPSLRYSLFCGEPLSAGQIP